MGEESEQIKRLKEAVAVNPADSSYIELAKFLTENVETRGEAREVCFAALSKEPRNPLGRLMLARAFYLDGMVEFCVRELIETARYSSSPALRRLIDSFHEYIRPYKGYLDVIGEGPVAAKAAAAEPEVVGEIDIEADFLDTLNDIEDE